LGHFDTDIQGPAASLPAHMVVCTLQNKFGSVVLERLSIRLPG
jgi:hypothetical protein